MRIRISISPFGKVPVERSHDGVGTSCIAHPLPLSDTGTTGIGHDGCPHLLEEFDQTVT